MGRGWALTDEVATRAVLPDAGEGHPGMKILRKLQTHTARNTVVGGARTERTMLNLTCSSR